MQWNGERNGFLMKSDIWLSSEVKYACRKVPNDKGKGYGTGERRDR